MCFRFLFFVGFFVCCFLALCWLFLSAFLFPSLFFSVFVFVTQDKIVHRFQPVGSNCLSYHVTLYPFVSYYMYYERYAFMNAFHLFVFHDDVSEEIRRGHRRNAPGCRCICVQMDMYVCMYVCMPGSSSTSDLKIGTPVATLPGAWHYRISAGTDRPGVSILWPDEKESLVCNFYLSVAAHKIVWADPSLGYTRIFLER